MNRLHVNTIPSGACFLVAFAIVLLHACGAPQQDSQEKPSETSEAFFTPKPQAVDEKPVQTLAIGDPAPDFRLPGVDGNYHELSDFADKEVLVINFTCNHCPTAQAYEQRFIDLATAYSPKGVQFIAISPNSPIAVLPEELGYTDLNDDFESMKIRAQEMNFNFPYLYDGDVHEFSTAYGPTATPHIFVFDKNRKLTYQGRIDASEKPGTGEAEDAIHAIETTLRGEALASDRATTPAFGCSIKWGWKNEYTLKVNEDWKKKPVDLSKIDLDELDQLLKNDSDQLRLVNFWATWCGPCIVEYPEFIEIQRMYGDRDFEFVSVSLDDPGSADKALKFLQKKYSATTNYLVDTEDKYAIIDVVKNDWDGSLPLTLLIEPGGKVHYKVPGTIDPLALKKTIVDHPMIGRYY
ncbi:redoxin domain-containing protein [Cyclobacterium xiamenense]|uniref:redoxin domain-containing protein n=1 Tax=Cyclobacterium xiamenense TaxID=1297121 RepID=UPI0012B8F26A|nr:redoxin domain-containing protein [Cyclobacterium xiamenense]